MSKQTLSIREALVRIQALCNSPGWHSDHTGRRNRIEQLAYDAIEQMPVEQVSKLVSIEQASEAIAKERKALEGK